MSCFGFGERPLLTKKAWKRFTSKLRTDGFHAVRSQRRHGYAQCFAPAYEDELDGQTVETRVQNAEAQAAAAKFEEVNVASGVDVRAEMFIRKFKKEREMERQRSFQEYQKMLARGV